ncbi:uncharacterized protein LOC108669810 isoform X1 [Hyalella azteca]|uniref:Uncharacterized protein LOC108669810 isoform X1 n=1 Tax=Hyalella azteca TaxID=294128 RepID=A0A979FQ70_HYAAZ|nr:uncharacterized protein LOC108669810 isoform X1 [Hyalella azteca]
MLGSIEQKLVVASRSFSVNLQDANGLDWSQDNRLALVTPSSVIVYDVETNFSDATSRCLPLPQINLASPHQPNPHYSSGLETASFSSEPRLSEAVRQKLLPLVLSAPLSAASRSLLSSQNLPPGFDIVYTGFRHAIWSPLGAGGLQRCVLAMTTADHRLLLVCGKGRSLRPSLSLGRRWANYLEAHNWPLSCTSSKKCEPESSSNERISQRNVVHSNKDVCLDPPVHQPANRNSNSGQHTGLESTNDQSSQARDDVSIPAGQVQTPQGNKRVKNNDVSATTTPVSSRKMKTGIKREFVDYREAQQIREIEVHVDRLSQLAIKTIHWCPTVMECPETGVWTSELLHVTLSGHAVLWRITAASHHTPQAAPSDLDDDRRARRCSKKSPRKQEQEDDTSNYLDAQVIGTFDLKCPGASCVKWINLPDQAEFLFVGDCQGPLKVFRIERDSNGNIDIFLLREIFGRDKLTVTNVELVDVITSGCDPDSERMVGELEIAKQNKTISPSKVPCKENRAPDDVGRDDGVLTSAVSPPASNQETCDGSSIDRERTSLDRDAITLDRERTSLDRDAVTLDRERTSLDRDDVTLDRERTTQSRDDSSPVEDRSSLDMQSTQILLAVSRNMVLSVVLVQLYRHHCKVLATAQAHVARMNITSIRCPDPGHVYCSTMDGRVLEMSILHQQSCSESTTLLNDLSHQRNSSKRKRKSSQSTDVAEPEPDSPAHNVIPANIIPSKALYDDGSKETVMIARAVKLHDRVEYSEVISVRDRSGAESRLTCDCTKYHESNSSLSLRRKVLKDFTSDGASILAMVTSPNSVFYATVESLRVPYDHLVMRECSHLIISLVCSSDTLQQHCCLPALRLPLHMQHDVLAAARILALEGIVLDVSSLLKFIPGGAPSDDVKTPPCDVQEGGALRGRQLLLWLAKLYAKLNVKFNIQHPVIQSWVCIEKSAQEAVQMPWLEQLKYMQPYLNS